MRKLIFRSYKMNRVCELVCERGYTDKGVKAFASDASIKRE